MKETPREEAINIAIHYVELAAKVQALEAESRRNNAVVRHLMKLSNQLRRKIGADPNPTYNIN